MDIEESFSIALFGIGIIVALAFLVVQFPL